MKFEVHDLHTDDEVSCVMSFQWCKQFYLVNFHFLHFTIIARVDPSSHNSLIMAERNEELPPPRFEPRPPAWNAATLTKGLASQILI